jgi:hypothetical protein
MRAMVRYEVGTYEGELEVFCEPDEDDRAIEARAKKALERKSGGPLPMGAQRFVVLRREG